MVGSVDAYDANSGRNLPVLVGTVQDRGFERRSTQAHKVRSDFASQLIASRDRMPTQRARRRESEGFAVSAYGRSARLDERRVPVGYRLSVSA